MNHEEIRLYCLSLPESEESFPFDAETLVFKHKGKIFAILSLDENPPRINLKCNPAYALELREKFNNVVPGYHMNKKHWNTVICSGGINFPLLKKWINDSFALIQAKTPKNK
ncbi:MAG: MmcQ/YjbR family DNA-binding protein [Sphingobacteriaceae bacterium]|nr:MmcQ/YjbR family DNA-binding protein [Sphingobacteriaceae bacterium]